MTTPNDLRHDTRPDRLGAGLYGFDLPDAWSYLMPSGGVLMTLTLRAMEAELGDDAFQPASATSIFCEPLPSGKLVSHVAVLRRGNAAVQLRASLGMAGATSVSMETLATFVRERAGIRLRDIEPPDVPKPHDSRVWNEPPIGVATRPYPVFEQVEQRVALGHPWWETGWTAQQARFARWFRFRVPQRAAEHFDPLALPLLVDTMPPALRQKLGPEAPQFYAPSLDLTVHFLERTTSEWVLVDSRCRCAVGAYATADTNVWGEDGRLAAYGTQTMFLRVPKAQAVCK